MCQVELPTDWHADHIIAHANGGETDVINGQALCPTCNRKKGTKNMSDPRNVWQKQAVEAFCTTHDDFLVTACPGAGKTLMAMKAAKILFDQRIIDRIIVIVPNNQVRKQWNKAAHGVGLDVTAEFKNEHGFIPKDSNGVVGTYAQVHSDKHIWRKLASKPNKTLVIFDEIHHCQDEENSSWGPSLLAAFEHVTRRLMLSGTPFRTDRNQIPFIKYDDEGRAISDGGISYKDAIIEGVVRPVRFPIMDGQGNYLRGTSFISATASTVDKNQQAALMRTLYQENQSWMTSLMTDADNELKRMREEKPNAGGLIVASDIEKAEAYAVMIERITNEKASVVHSKDATSNAVIDQFRTSHQRWIVAVDMISEGVDIPRLSIIVYASNKTTDMWFRQIVGRAVRRDNDSLTATVYIGAFPELVKLAKNIEDEVDLALEIKVGQLELMSKAEARDFDIQIIQPISTSPIIQDSVLMPGGVQITEAELNQALAYQEKIQGLQRSHTSDIALLIRELGKAPAVTIAHAQLPAKTDTKDALRVAKKQQVNQLVNKVARDTDTPYGHIHAELNRMFGDRLGNASLETLDKRIQELQSWL